MGVVRRLGQRGERPDAAGDLLGGLALGRKMAGDMVPGSRFAIALRHYGLRALKYHPRKERVIERVTRPLHEAASAIALRDDDPVGVR